MYEIKVICIRLTLFFNFYDFSLFTVYLYNIGRRFISIATPFDAARNPNASPKCRRQMRRFLEGLNNFDFWALKSK